MRVGLLTAALLLVELGCNEPEISAGPALAPSVRWFVPEGEIPLVTEPVCLDNALVDHDGPDVLECVWPCHLYFATGWADRGVATYFHWRTWERVEDGTPTGQWVLDPSRSGTMIETECP